MSEEFHWSGRFDGDEAIHRRFFQVIAAETSVDQIPTFGLIGFCCDEGVRRNKGRLGARNAPNLIRSQMASLPIHTPVTIQDMGNVVCENGELETAQQNLSKKITALLDQGTTPIVLGGGHETAFGSFQGIFQHVQNQHKGESIGIINFDAHFDLRDAEVPTSGTPFLNSANLLKDNNQAFHYLCLGIAKHANTKVLFQTADTLKVTYIEDNALLYGSITDSFAQIKAFIDQVDHIYITIDLDVFSAHIAPGVSAPAVRGISITTFEQLFNQIIQSQKVRLLDIVECNPEFDIDNHTSKLAAYIAYQFIQQIITKDSI